MTTSTAARPEGTETRTYPAYSRPLWQRVLFTREAAIIGLLVAVFAYASANVLNFDGPLTIYYLLLDIAPILLIALPMTLVIITGEIDLSVASVVGLSSVLVGILHQDFGFSIPVAALLAILAGAVAGAFNGFLVAYVGLPSLAVTIGTLALYRGLAVGLLGTTAVTDFPEKWTDLAKQRIGESSYPVIVIPFLVLLVLFVLLLHFSSFGRGVFEIGLNDEAAHFTGVNGSHEAHPLRAHRRRVGAGRRLLHAALRQRPRRQRHRARAPGDRGSPARRRLDLRWPRRLHGVVAGVILLGVLSSACAWRATPSTSSTSSSGCCSSPR